MTGGSGGTIASSPSRYIRCEVLNDSGGSTNLQLLAGVAWQARRQPSASSRGERASTSLRVGSDRMPLVTRTWQVWQVPRPPHTLLIPRPSRRAHARIDSLSRHLPFQPIGSKSIK